MLQTVKVCRFVWRWLFIWKLCRLISDLFLQTSFQMNNETLYLTVKLVDHYLMKAQCKKDHLQLLGSTAYMIAAKLEVSLDPKGLRGTNQISILNREGIQCMGTDIHK